MSESSNATTRQSYYQHDIYHKMVDEWGIFDSLVDFFVFSACVGYAVSDRPTVDAYSEKEFQGTKSDNTRGEMLWMHFSNKQTYRAVAASIAYQHTGDSNALVNPEVQLEVLARYARAGVDHLEQEFGNSASPPRDGLVSFIDTVHDERGSSESDDILSSIVNSFDDDMMGT